MTTDELVALAEGIGLTPEDLDEAVHETASKRASEVNNGGLEAQIDYLIDAFGPQGARSVIEECDGEYVPAAQVQDTPRAAAPGDSTHQGAWR
jgi:hypothetical protein